MQQDKDIRDFIKNKRLATGKTLNNFALDADVDSAIISRIENKKQGIKLDVFVKIATALGVKPSELLSEWENLTNHTN